MASLKLFMSFAILCLSSFLFSFTTATTYPNYLYHFCSDNNFTSDSTYQTNLDRVLVSLQSATNNNNGFHNASEGQDHNRVYGLFQCRGDFSTDICQDCVIYAAREVNRRCPVAKGVVIWYDECLLRYSDDFIFSTLADKPSFGLMNTNNVTEPERFSEPLTRLMSSASSIAAIYTQRYARITGNITASQKVNVLIQCTQDLSSSDCTRCLQSSIVNLPKGEVGGRMIYPSCYSMYEMYPFQNPFYLYHVCSDNHFTSNSTYQSNLERLLSSLTNFSNQGHGFYRTTKGQDPNIVYGLFQCRGDLSTISCQECITFASKEVTRRCPAHKGAMIWFDECYFRFLDTDFDAEDLKQSHQSRLVMWNPQNVTIETAQFHELLLDMMQSAASEAVESLKKFATKKKNFTRFRKMYGLVQCTQDLFYTDCRECLTKVIANMPTGIEGGRFMLSNCISRYELYPFYDENLIALLPITPTSSPSPPSPGKREIFSSTIIAIIVPIIVAAVLSAAGYCFLTRRAGKKCNTLEDEITGNDMLTVETLQFDLGTIQAATNRFSTDNKLGSGGFGEVYKGVLPNGQEIVVKRLSKRSGQGAKEFKNEVIVVAKLQHRNLVRLQGFCLEGEEKILVYEFVPNKSLDYFLYDIEKRAQLDWPKRYKIIGGIARGILYLHEDSRLRIIHRDLKASNVLLDGDMNPKISDFGMARIVGNDQTQGSTNRIVGTYGYMSPEYAMQGQFSVKSDVYSFGVLVLEIITGRKNSSFYQANCTGVGNLMSYAWEHWRDEKSMQLLDSNLADSYSENEVMRCIHVGLLCVQEDPTGRPTMATVIHMLNSYSISPPLPQQPAFFLSSRTELNMHISQQPTSNSVPLSINDASITQLSPR